MVPIDFVRCIRYTKPYFVTLLLNERNPLLVSLDFESKPNKIWAVSVKGEGSAWSFAQKVVLLASQGQCAPSPMLVSVLGWAYPGIGTEGTNIFNGMLPYLHLYNDSPTDSTASTWFFYLHGDARSYKTTRSISFLPPYAPGKKNIRQSQGLNPGEPAPQALFIPTIPSLGKLSLELDPDRRPSSVTVSPRNWASVGGDGDGGGGGLGEKEQSAEDKWLERSEEEK